MTENESYISVTPLRISLGERLLYHAKDREIKLERQGEHVYFLFDGCRGASQLVLLAKARELLKEQLCLITCSSCNDKEKL